MPAGIALYTNEEFETALTRLIAELTLPAEVCPQTKPVAYLLGGQSGAGKTTIHDILKERFRNDVIVINGDEYRSMHPRNKEIDEAFGPEAVNHTAAWANALTEALIYNLSRMGYNLIIEGTLRTTEIPIKTANLLHERGYIVALAIMAVKPEISLISCQIRYEQMRIAGTIPRATDSDYHNKIVSQIVRNLKMLECSRTFDGIYLFSRTRDYLYPLMDETRKASRVLEEVLFGEWSPAERMHYEFLQEVLERLKATRND